MRKIQKEYQLNKGSNDWFITKFSCKSYVKSVVASEEIWCLDLFSKIVKIIAINVPSWKYLFTPSRNRLNLTSELWGKSLGVWFLCCVKNLFNMLAQNVGIYFLICACVSFPINNLSDALLRNRKIRKCGFFLLHLHLGIESANLVVEQILPGKILVKWKSVKDNQL